jgi:hypothetical protein
MNGIDEQLRTLRRMKLERDELMRELSRRLGCMTLERVKVLHEFRRTLLHMPASEFVDIVTLLAPKDHATDVLEILLDAYLSVCADCDPQFESDINSVLCARWRDMS